MSDALLTAYGAVLLDLDGTVYHGSRGIPGAAEVIGEIREHGTAVRFVTNNASKSPAEVAAHLSGLGIPTEPVEVATSAGAAARLLGERLEPGADVLVVGTESLADEVRAAGLRPVREAGPGVAAVVQGHSPHTAWPDLAEACVALRAGALWVASNVDATLPTERGQLPGNGSMVAVLRTATGLEPLVAGKPAAPLLLAAAEAGGTSGAVVVGDRLDTDIAGATAAGLDALVVLTGVATPASLLAAIPAERPRYLAADLGGLRREADELAIGPRPDWQVKADGGRLVVTGSGTDPVDLLRALCATAWETGHTTCTPGDTQARAALDELGLL
ncbi:HAD-IIA family hydrolase [Amycolatopsis suaedae]|uniref:HAD-IIA family hydrolase n=1 Tax=Amycolatopsis suaedae TaxID=2510978 RepID=A0A4Q7IZ54_9PSEU|nr:HAD-IIA family hydrolase [Amycolatopsis suaedae]RZQ60311.1 HAD-IIA family hydrolase [Amycolatopsis suaedae]